MREGKNRFVKPKYWQKHIKEESLSESFGNKVLNKIDTFSHILEICIEMCKHLSFLKNFVTLNQILGLNC